MASLNEVNLNGLKFVADEPSNLADDGLIGAIMSAGEQTATLLYAQLSIVEERNKLESWLGRAKAELQKRLAPRTRSVP